VTLVQKHVAKDVAIAACGHRLSAETLRTILQKDVNIEPGNVYGLCSYLQAVIAANHVNPGAVSDLEAQRARELLAANAVTDSPGQYLRALVKILIGGVPSSFLVYRHIDALARRACKDFALQLETLKLEGQWLRACKAASWLSEVVELSVQLAPEDLGPEQLLDSAFPAWRVWAAWRPDVGRLNRWSELSNNHVSLRDVLVLEGPDFISRKSTLKEGALARGFSLSSSTIRVGNVQFILSRGILNEARLMLDTLYDAIDAASSLGPNDTELLAHLCVGKPITHDSLNILEVVRSLGDPSISAILLQVYGANGSSRSTQMAGVMLLLPVLRDERTRTLRDIIAPDLIGLISNCVNEMQRRVQKQLTAGRPWCGLEQKLQAFGNGLQEVFWLRPLLDISFQVLLNSWPKSEEIQVLQDLRISAQNATPVIASSLTKKIDLYCMDRLVKRGVLDEPTEQLVDTLKSLWMDGPEADLCSVALIIAQGPGFSTKFRCRCLSLLPSLPPGFIYTIRLIIQGWQDGKADTACIDLARLLACTPASEATEYWRRVLYRMLGKQEMDLVSHAVTNLRATDWIQLVADVHLTCDDQMPSVAQTIPIIMYTTLQSWVNYLSVHATAITRLEEDMQGFGRLPRCILTGGDGSLNASLEHILDLLTMYYGGNFQPPMLALMKMLASDGQNAAEICKVLSLLIATTKDGIDTCMRVLDLHQGTASPQVASALLASWLQDTDLDNADRRTLKALAEMLNLEVDSRGRLPAESLAAAADYLDAQFATLFAEAQRLETLRVAFKALDSAGISEMLESIHVENPSLVEDELAKLPTALIGLVEKVGDREVELQFPLTQLRPLQRIAMGIGNAQSLIIRLDLGDYSIPAGFCLHLDNESNSSESAHQPWEVAQNNKIPDRRFCHGRANRTSYQLARKLTRHLHMGFKSLEDIHTVVTAALNDLPQCCIVCGIAHNVPLRRSAVCSLPGCSTLFFRASLEVRLAEIQNDPQVVDLLLTMVHHAASTGDINLLPGCPFPDTTSVLALLKTMPAIATLSKANDLTRALKLLGLPTEKLLSWVCLSYRGFLTSATGTLRVPGMPAGTHQFLLANAAPEIETAHAGQLAGLPTRVLWHGTSLGRLFSIINQGLRVMSGTTLQAHGASSGHGVYTADEPSTSWAYSNPNYGYRAAGIPSNASLFP
jgi:hypothetical protein